jgi:hypothetical protein
VSRGPGRIERAIRALFDAHPDEAFTTDDLANHCYRLELWQPVERKHRVAVLRAVETVLATDPDWKSTTGHSRGAARYFWNAASVASTAMAFIVALGGDNSDRAWLTRRTRDELASDRARQPHEQRVRQHIAVRDAVSHAEAARLVERQRAADMLTLAQITGNARLANAALGIHALPKTRSPTFDNTKALAAKARALMVENAPDAVRDGLAEIAAALDAMTGT